MSSFPQFVSEPRSDFHTHRLVLALLGFCSMSSTCLADLDMDLNTLSDVWQRKFGVGTISASADLDGDGFTNAQEFLFATNPNDSSSRPNTSHSLPAPGFLNISWFGETGKIYTPQTSLNLASWSSQPKQTGRGASLTANLTGASGSPLFSRVAVTDVDSDGDGLSDWEELASGFNPSRVFSEGLGSNPTTPTTNNPRITDRERLASSLNSSFNSITVAAADPAMSEDWPDPGRFVIRRTGSLDALNISFSYGGTATNGTDYTALPPVIKIPFGADEIAIHITPLTDGETEATETVTLTLLTGTGYTLGSNTTASLNLADSSGANPSAKPATRFLVQSTFGPTTDEVTRVMNLGYSAWIEDQFLRAPNLHLPIVQTWQAELQTTLFTVNSLVSSEHRIESWWRQSMRGDAASDPLRQRMAFALSQIFVISDKMESLNGDQRGMTSYYDMLLNGAFGTYRQLLENVTRHPWMGLYLSAMKNRKANPALNRFPDENYAREVMQLFSIGLWRLNPDGTQYLSNGSDLGPDGETIPAGNLIPTYGQLQISEIARVFTGMSYGTRFTLDTDATEIPTTKFYDSYGVPWQPMRIYDGEHDQAAKSISFPGMVPLVLPARTGTTTTSSTGGNADLTAFLDYLASHPNV
ncbi:MAG: DUF1800 family protein, partial [Gloeobacteraceae cyanobacterium ES-bin-144]|nr:DUF1800 family protein [Verrucomicrobiales bacterium]